MSGVLRICLVIGVVIYMTFIVILLRKRKLNLKYSLLWMLSAVVLLLLAVFPQIAVFVSELLGIQSAVNAIYLIIVFFMLLLLISLSSIVSKQHREIKTLIQHVAIIEKRLRDLEEIQK